MLRKMIQDQKAKSGIYPNTPIGEFNCTMDRLERDLYFELRIKERQKNMIGETPRQRKKAILFSQYHAVLILYNMV